MKSVVVISKDWHQPEIHVRAAKEGLFVSMDLVDFMDIVLKEAGSVTWQFNNAAFRTKIDNATDKVFEKMKEETIRVA